MSQRGGSVQRPRSRIGGARSSEIADGMADVLVALEPMEAARALPKLSKRTAALVNTGPLLPGSLQSTGRPYPPLSSLLDPIDEAAASLATVDATSLAERAGSPRCLNVVMLGMLAGARPPARSRATELLAAILASALPAFAEINRKAFRLGAEAVNEVERVMKVGIDVGGTFTDFLVTDDGRRDPGRQGPLHSRGPLDRPAARACEELAEERGQSLAEFAARHRRRSSTARRSRPTPSSPAPGAKTGLLTTEGVRDALEMRRGIREEQYNNRYTNVPPLVPRYLRRPVRGRLDHAGDEIEPLCARGRGGGGGAARGGGRRGGGDLLHELLRQPGARAPGRGDRARAASRRLPLGLHRGPALDPLLSPCLHDGAQLLRRSGAQPLPRQPDRGGSAEIGFAGVLLIMQSNGGVVSPEVARDRAAVTLLSGPAAGPSAGMAFAEAHGYRDCITVDMGGTSFDAALVRDGQPLTVTEGEVNRYSPGPAHAGHRDHRRRRRQHRLARRGRPAPRGPAERGRRSGPGLLRQGRRPSRPSPTPTWCSAGSIPASSPAGGCRSTRRRRAARSRSSIAGPLGLSVAEAAAGIARVVDSNMAAGVREITIRRGYDPREFPMVVAGGAGPNHACAIATELELPLFIVPRESSIFCAAGMLMTDLKHDVVKSRIVAPRPSCPRRSCDAEAEELAERGRAILREENVPEDRIRDRWSRPRCATCGSTTRSACRCFPLEDLETRFHAEHNRLYGYSLAEEGTPLELINLRVRAVGVTDKPAPHRRGARRRRSAATRRRASAPSGSRRSGSSDRSRSSTATGCASATGSPGPAVVEQRNTTLFVSAAFDMVVDAHGLLRRLPPGPRGRAAGVDPGGCAMIDPILASVFARAFKSITDEMSISLQRTTRSPILCEAKDFVTGLYDAEGRMLEQTENLPILSFSLGAGLQVHPRLLRRRPPRRAT